MITNICEVILDNENRNDVFLFLKNKNVIKNKSGYFLRECNFKKYFPKLYDEFQKNIWKEKLPFKILLWHFLQYDENLNLGLCKICGKRCTFKRFTTGYTEYCSPQCMHSDKSLNEKMKNSISQRSKEYINSIQTKIKATKKERYGDANYNNREKCKKTCVEKYGVDNVSKSIEIKDKIKNTQFEKYGVDNVFKSECIKKKIKQTNIEKYGFESPMKSDVVKLKQRMTILEHFNGLWNSQTEEWLNSIHKTKFEKYGDANYNNKEKSKKTCIEKYGVENISQIPGIQSKKRKKLYYDGLTFDSTWEIEVYMYCQENNKNCIYQPHITFTYYYDGKLHKYHPDFLIDGKYYEVKGDQFFEGDKMICPYNRNDYMDGKFEAKHQCMIKNGVIILRKDNLFDIK